MIIDSVKAAIARYNMLEGKKSVTVALSGGADSVVLLHVLNILKDEYGFELKAAHLNHMLRGDESDRDEMFSKQVCLSLGVPFVSERADVAAAAKSGESIELAARRLRYEFLLRTAGDGFLATAHNANDNLETVLHNMARGTGLTGLCGIPPVRDNIIRPLIFVTREEIEKYAADNSISFVTDSTNLEDAYTRNKIRHNIVPELIKINGAAVSNVGRMCLTLNYDASFIKEETGKALELCRSKNGVLADKTASLHPAIRSRVIAELYKEKTGASLESRGIALVEEMLEKGGTRVNVKGNIFAVQRKGNLTFETDAKNENGFFVRLCSFPFSGNGLKIEIVDAEEYKKTHRINSLLLKCAVDYDKICGEPVIRSRMSGDKICLAGRNVTKSFKKLFNENSVPEPVRATVPVLADEKGVLWLGGFGADRRAAVDGSTKRILFISGLQNLEV